MPTNDNTPAAPTNEERLAEIEGKLASSWALKTRTEYENEFRQYIKNELLSYTTKLVIAALVLISGAGYLFIKSAILEVYQSQNKELIDNLKAKYELNLGAERKRFEWRRHHDYGKTYIYFAKLYYDNFIGSNIPPQKKIELVSHQFDRAETYFEYAMRADPEEATTYWELGELYYTYAKDYGLPARVDPNKALYYYELAIKSYSDAEISKGWRGDPYRVAGKIYLEWAKDSSKNHETCLSKAKEYLNAARGEYTKAIPESRDYNAERIKEVDDLLLAFPQN